MTLLSYEGLNLVPGQLPAVEAIENELTFLYWGRLDQQVIGYNVVIDGSAEDAGNTGFTDVLRPGLLLGKVTSSGKYKQWSPTATDGTQHVAAILILAQKMHKAGSNTDRFVGHVLLGGLVKSYGVVIPSETEAGIVGKDDEYTVRAQLSQSFRFDDDPFGHKGGIPASAVTPVAKTADYAVLEADNGKLFTNTGAAAAVNFTLPATPTRGLSYTFYATADFELKVTAGTADTMVAFNDAAADSVAYGTAGQIMGNAFKVIGDGTKWLVMAIGDGTVTIVT